MSLLLHVKSSGMHEFFFFFLFFFGDAGSARIT